MAEVPAAILDYKDKGHPSRVRVTETWKNLKLLTTMDLARQPDCLPVGLFFTK